MRTILRVGITVGGVAFVVLYPLQSAIGLAVTPGIILAGLCAGLGAAKWLERPWFGRQFAAGLRTGVIAVGMAGVSVLLALLTKGVRSVDQLTARSHVIGINLGPLISHLAPVGWVGVDMTVVALAMCAGIGLSILATELGALGKSRHAIRIVNQARLAAHAGLHGDSPSVAPASGPTAAGMHASRVGAALPDSPAMGRSSGVGAWPAASASGTSLGNHSLVPPESASERFQQTEPALRADLHRSSKARPADSQLTEAMREALATWASDSNTGQQDSGGGAAGTPDSRVRAPQPSTYLNSSPPVPSKRARKKQNTEWLC